MTDPAYVRTGGHPLHHAFTAFPTACFSGALLTDIAYWKTAEMQWANFSAWLLAFGLLMAAFAILAGLIDAVIGWRIAGGRRPGLIHVLGNLIAVLLSLLNSFVHSRDAYTSVVPEGLLLSLLVVAILSLTGWWGHETAYRLEAR